MTRMANNDRWRQPSEVPTSSMLSVCAAPGCSTIVFGRGTCVAHDPPRLRLADRRQGEAVGRGRAVSRQ